MSQEIRNQDFIPEEIWLVSSGNETASPLTEAMADFDSAVKAQNDAFRILMRGEGHSVAEDSEQTDSLLINTAKSFGRLAVAILDDDQLSPEESAQQISWLFYSSRQKRIEFLHSLEESVQFEPNDLEELTEAISAVIAGEYDGPDDDDIEVKLEHAFGNVCSQDMTAMLPHMPDNKAEVRKARRAAQRAVVIRSLGEIAKIGAGAAVALVANRFINRK